MNKLIVLGAVTAGGAIVFRCLPQAWHDRLAAAVKNRVAKGCERMMGSLPEAAPPKLIMSVLPKLLAQNVQIIAMLQEQNALLREQQHARMS